MLETTGRLPPWYTVVEEWEEEGQEKEGRGRGVRKGRRKRGERGRRVKGGREGASRLVKVVHVHPPLP